MGGRVLEFLLCNDCRVNNAISYLDVVEDETTGINMRREVCFSVLWEYFNLVRLWGPVFIVTSKFRQM